MRISSILILLLVLSGEITCQKTFQKTAYIMGCAFEITIIADSQSKADKYIDSAIAEMKRIEKLISSWDSSSQTTEINKNAGIKPTKVDIELYELITRSIAISQITDGAFDISYASMDRIWRFDSSMTTFPDSELIKNSIAKVGFHNIICNPKDTSVFLKKEGMKIGFGAIGKGYAADKAKALLKKHGVAGGIINASGDMNTWGKQTNGDDWKIAITNPLDKTKSYGSLPLKKGAVVTSGNYEKYALIDGKRYAHIIDPRTGIPAQGISSVTVFSPSAELADAVATAVFVMGIEIGIDRINQLPELDCIIIGDDGQLHYSTNIKINMP